jgi:Raf kinase inhibitor-like protein, YbhB/YbcL family
MNFHSLIAEREEAATCKKIKVSSEVFKSNAFIPRRYACDGVDVNPSLNIDQIPKKTQSLVIVVDDPDAPSGTWVHWVMWNIPVTHFIKENDAPGVQGLNDSGKHDYSGPCPPRGTHRYFFKVYALDCKLELPTSSDKTSLTYAMENHILGFGELIGLYRRD